MDLSTGSGKYASVVTLICKSTAERPVYVIPDHVLSRVQCHTGTVLISHNVGCDRVLVSDNRGRL